MRLLFTIAICIVMAQVAKAQADEFIILFDASIVDVSETPRAEIVANNLHSCLAGKGRPFGVRLYRDWEDGRRKMVELIDADIQSKGWDPDDMSTWEMSEMDFVSRRFGYLFFNGGVRSDGFIAGGYFITELTLLTIKLGVFDSVIQLGSAGLSGDSEYVCELVWSRFIDSFDLLD
jgi:hypothetical protein